MSINKVAITPEGLVVEPIGMNRIWAFTRCLRFPLGHVRGATFDPGMRDEPKGWRGPGLGLPGKLAGTFHSNGKRQFWNISGYDRAIVITLDPAERYDRVVITVDDPQQVVDAVNSVAGAR
jgi:hypothetical protein